MPEEKKLKYCGLHLKKKEKKTLKHLSLYHLNRHNHYWLILFIRASINCSKRNIRIKFKTWTCRENWWNILNNWWKVSIKPQAVYNRFVLLNQFIFHKMTNENKKNFSRIHTILKLTNKWKYVVGKTKRKLIIYVFL